MQLTTQEILKIAHLARLGMSEEEAKKFGPQLSGLLEHAQMLKEVDTENVNPIGQITGLQDVFFKDEVEAFDKSKALLEQSPQKVQENMVKVPKTL